MSNKTYLRKAELLIWPSDESVQAGDDTALKIVSDGTREHLRMGFTVNKSIIGTPNSSQVLLYNLKKETRDFLRKPLLRCSLRVGWENYGLFEIFNGGLVTATHQRQGADIITRIIMLTGITGSALGVTSKTFGAGTKLSDILKTLVSDLSGVQYDPNRVKIIDGEIKHQGISFAGSTRDFLDKLAMQYGFSWSIQDGVFQAIQDGQSFGRNLLISTQAKTLFNVTPILNGPLQVQTGVCISAFLIPNLLPGDTVTVESEVNPQLNGIYMAHTITYCGDTFGNDWNMSIQAFRDFSEGTVNNVPIYEIAK
jgi:hypothetical protein